MFHYQTVIDREALDEVMRPLFQKTQYRIKLVIALELVAGFLVAAYMAKGSAAGMVTFLIYGVMTIAIAVVLSVTTRKKYDSAIERSITQNLEKVQKQYHADRVVKSWRIEDTRILPESKDEKELSLADLQDITITTNYILATFKGKTVQIIAKTSIEGGSEEEFTSCLKQCQKK